MAAYIVAQDDVDRLRQVAKRFGVQLPDVQISSKVPREDDVAPKLSRQTLKLFVSIYALTNVYENIAIGLLRRKHVSRFLKDLISRSSAGFAAFVAAYSLVYRLARIALRSTLPGLATSFRKAVHTPREERSAGRESWRPHLRSGLYRLLDAAWLPAFLAGVVASPTLLLDPSAERRTTTAMYTLQRAAQTSWLTACSAGWIPRVLRSERWFWGGHILFAISNAQLLHAFVFDSDCFPESYSKFILRFSDAYVPKRPTSLPPSAPWPAPRQLVDFVAFNAKAKSPYPAFNSPLLRPSVTIPSTGPFSVTKPVLDLSHPLQGRLSIPMSLAAQKWLLVRPPLHLGRAESVTRKCTVFARREFSRATRFFVILSAIRMAISWRKTKSDPLTSLVRAAKFSIGSGAGVAGCIGAAWASICFFQAYLPNTVLPTRRFYLQGFLAGLFILLSPARSIDLGLYSARLALQSAWQVAVKRGTVRNVRNGEVIPFAIASGAVMAIYERGSEEIVTGMVRKLLNVVAAPL